MKSAMTSCSASTMCPPFAVLQPAGDGDCAARAASADQECARSFRPGSVVYLRLDEGHSVEHAAVAVREAAGVFRSGGCFVLAHGRALFEAVLELQAAGFCGGKSA
jgi:hypothetical protein